MSIRHYQAHGRMELEPQVMSAIEMARFIMTGKEPEETKEKICERCGVDLSEEEIDHCGYYCFDCAIQVDKDVYGEWKHPDDRG